MNPERCAATAFAASLALVAGLAVAAERLAPGVKRVCVPAEDGRTWECGTLDNPPPQRPIAPRDSPPPPSFLASPGSAEVMPLVEAPSGQATPLERARTDDFPSAPDRDEAAVADASTADAQERVVEEKSQSAPESEPGDPVTEDASAQEIATEDAVDSPAESATAVSSASSEPPILLQPPRRRGLAPGPPISPEIPAEAVAESAPAAEKTVEPEPLVEPESSEVADAEPEPVPPPDEAAPIEQTADAGTAEPEAPAPDAPAPEDVPDVVADAPADDSESTGDESEPPAAVDDSALAAQPRDADAFRALAGTGYTVQLAHAERPDGFAQALAELGVDARDAYALPVRRDGRRWWMLVWSSFADAASAREATARLPRSASVNVGYPRRIALIQRELHP
ncbi:MAG TPA: hypothetical protein VND91_10365 [Candidatus Saccharimonadia bacterium]|nr:hypothetical protein [Candidatus Saccharimonadia bacterium]